MAEGPTRRLILKTVGVMGFGGLAGCMSRDSPASNPTLSPTEPNQSASNSTVEATTHPKECSSDYERVNAYIEHVTLTNQLDGFVLNRSKDSVQQGETMSFYLTNESDEEKNTGNNSKYDIQHRNDDGWESIFWKNSDELVMYHDDAILHPPKEGFTWKFTMNRDDLSQEIEHGSGHLEVCTPLLPGSYRFVFHGKVKHVGDDQRTVLGSEFSITN